MSAGTEIALYLIRNVGALILLVVVLRGVLHTSRVNFYNPISQLVVRLTNPLLQPLRGVLPRQVARLGSDRHRGTPAVLILAGIAWVAGDRWALPGLPTCWRGGRRRAGFAGQPVFFHPDRHDHRQLGGTRQPASAIELIWQISEPVMAPFVPYCPTWAASISPRFYCSLAST